MKIQQYRAPAIITKRPCSLLYKCGAGKTITGFMAKDLGEEMSRSEISAAALSGRKNKEGR